MKNRKTHGFVACKGNGTCDPSLRHCGECANVETDPVHRPDLSPWQRHALASVRGAGPLGTTQYSISKEMKRDYRDLDRPLANLVAWGLLQRSEAGVYTATKQEDAAS